MINVSHRAIVRVVVCCLVVFLSMAVVVNKAAAKATKYGPYTVSQLLHPIVLEKGRVIVALGGLKVDNLASRYVPDISEMTTVNDLPGYDVMHTEIQLRMHFCGLVPRDSVDKVGIAQVIVYGEDRSKFILYSRIGGGSPDVYQIPPKRYLGMYLIGLSDARKDKTRTKYGAWVMALSPIGPAYKAGIRKGDVVLKMNAKPIRTQEDADAVVNGGMYGMRPITMTILRSGKQINVTVHPIEDPLDSTFAKSSERAWQLLLKENPNKSKRFGYIWSDFVSDESVPASFKPARIDLIVGQR